MAEEKDRGNEAWKNGEYAKAIAHFSNAIDASSDKDFLKVLYSNRSASYLKLKQNEVSLADAVKCIELDQNWTKGYMRKGDALMSLKKYADAYNTYNAGLRIDAKDKILIEKAEQAMNRIASEPSQPSGRGWGSQQQQPPQQSSRSSSLISGILGKIVTYCQWFILANALFYMIPFWRAFSLASYKRAAYATLLCTLLAVYSKYGMPKLSMDYAQRMMGDPMIISHSFLAVMMITARPYMFVLVPIVLMILQGYSENLFGFARRNLPRLEQQARSLLQRFAPQMANQRFDVYFSQNAQHQFNNQLIRISANAEVMQGVYLIVELCLPSRSFMTTMLWWQYLQMRYMLDNAGQIRSAFASLDGTILQLTGHRLCPKAIGQAYSFVRTYLAKQVQRSPAQGGGGGAGGPSLSSLASKCTVM